MKIKWKELFYGFLSKVFNFHLQQQHKELLNTIEQSGLGGTKSKPQLNALGKFRMAVIPSTKSRSLSEILEEMSDKEHNSIELYAKMIVRMTTLFSDSSYQGAKKLYPKIGSSKHFMLAQLLKSIQPSNNTDSTEEEDARRSTARLAISEAMLKRYVVMALSHSFLVTLF